MSSTLHASRKSSVVRWLVPLALAALFAAYCLFILSAHAQLGAPPAAHPAAHPAVLESPAERETPAVVVPVQPPAVPQPAQPAAEPFTTAASDVLAKRLAAAVSYTKQLVKRRKNERRGGLASKDPDDEDSEDAAAVDGVAAVDSKRHRKNWLLSSSANAREQAVVQTFRTVEMEVLCLASLNLWNVAADWPARRQLIAQLLLQEVEPDVVALQEVRRFGNGTLQLDQLLTTAGMAERFPYTVYHPAATGMNEENPEEGVEEGVAILSRFPIEETSVWQLDPGGKVDKSSRIGLRARVRTASGLAVEVVSLHLSWADLQQCSAVSKLLEHVTSMAGSTFAILGDFNTYFGYDWPFDIMLLPRSTTSQLANITANPCRTAQLDLLNRFPQLPQFTDAVEVLHGALARSTFSNEDDWKQPWNDNPASRPDRVLVHGDLVSIAAANFGLTASAEQLQPSDHQGVWAAFGIKKKNSDTKSGATKSGATNSGLAAQMDVHTAAMRKVAPRLIKNKVVFDKYAVNGLMNSTTLGRILKKDKVIEVFKLHDTNHDQFLSWLEMVPFLFPSIWDHYWEPNPNGTTIGS